MLKQNKERRFCQRWTALSLKSWAFSPKVVLHPANASASSCESLFLDVVEHEGESLSFLTIGLDSNGGGSLDLLGGAVSVVLAVAEPLSEIISGFNFNEWHVAGLGESINEFLVLWVIAVFS